MKSGDLSAAASRLAAAISLIEAEVARMNGLVPANEFPTTVPSTYVPTVPTTDDAVDEMPADTRALLPLVDLTGRKVVSLCSVSKARSSRKRTEATE
jgi:hypothetical protein